MRLMANPAAGAMAMSALGFGIASHAFGLWAGALTGAAQASQRLFVPLDCRMASARRRPQAAGVAPQAGEAGAEGASPTSEPAEASRAVARGRMRRPTCRLCRPSPRHRPSAVAGGGPSRAVEAKPAWRQSRSQLAKAGSRRLQPEDFHKPRAIERPAEPDDLKAISGIGPKLEKVLNDLGVWTYAQIAAWEGGGRLGRRLSVVQGPHRPRRLDRTGAGAVSPRAKKGELGRSMHLAELNIARLKYPFDDPRVAEFADNLDRVNGIAERSEGFVWRLQDDGGDATDIRAFDDPLVIVNMSVWHGPENPRAVRLEHRPQAVLPQARRMVRADGEAAFRHVVGRRGASADAGGGQGAARPSRPRMATATSPSAGRTCRM